jgi:hypothetical protein
MLPKITACRIMITIAQNTVFAFIFSPLMIMTNVSVDIFYDGVC